MAEENITTSEAATTEPAVLDYTVWHPEFRTNHIYIDNDGKEMYWAKKSADAKPMLKYVE
jgi:hypothetical protein